MIVGGNVDIGVVKWFIVVVGEIILMFVVKFGIKLFVVKGKVVI